MAGQTLQEELAPWVEAASSQRLAQGAMEWAANILQEARVALVAAARSLLGGQGGAVEAARSQQLEQAA